VVWEARERFGRSGAGAAAQDDGGVRQREPDRPDARGARPRRRDRRPRWRTCSTGRGTNVVREFYVNDAGGQVFRLAHAVYARATELDGTVPVEPLDAEDYQGEYVKDVARAWLATRPDLRKPFAELREPLRRFATRLDPRPPDQAGPGAVRRPHRQLLQREDAP